MPRSTARNRAPVLRRRRRLWSFHLRCRHESDFRCAGAECDRAARVSFANRGRSISDSKNQHRPGCSRALGDQLEGGARDPRVGRLCSFGLGAPGELGSGPFLAPSLVSADRGGLQIDRRLARQARSSRPPILACEVSAPRGGRVSLITVTLAARWPDSRRRNGRTWLCDHW
jgi:hypothetical protein